MSGKLKKRIKKRRSSTLLLLLQLIVITGADTIQPTNVIAPPFTRCNLWQKKKRKQQQVMNIFCYIFPHLSSSAGGS